MHVQLDSSVSSMSIKKKNLFLLFVVLSTFEISYLSFISLPIKIIYLLLQSIVIFLGMVNIFSNKEYDFSDIILIGFIIVEFISTILNHEGLKELILNTKTLLLLYISFKWAIRLRLPVYINYMAWYLLSITVVNTLTAIACYPNALFYYDEFAPAFLIGADNTSTRIYILTVAFSALKNYIGNVNKSNVMTLVSIFNFIIYSFVRDIGNGKVCSILFIVSYIAFELLRFNMIDRCLRKIVFSNYILCFFMVVLNKIDIFSFIIVDLLNRDLTLTTRTTIWSITVAKVLDNPWLGNGYMSGENFENMLPSIIGINAHNTILMIAFIGGLILSLLFYFCIMSLISEYDKNYENKKIWILPIAFCALFLRSQVEGGDGVYLIAMAALVSSVAWWNTRRCT